MKKKIVALSVLVLCSLMLFAGCGKGSFNVDTKEKSAKVTAEKAGKGSAGGAIGAMTVKQGEKMYISTAIEKGKITVRITDPNSDSDKPAYQKTFKDTRDVKVKLKPGSYSFTATVVKKATGTIKVKIK